MKTSSPPRTTIATRPRSALWLTALVTAVAPTVWGTTYLVTTELLPPGHPMFAALTRSLPAGLIALVLSRRLPRGRWCCDRSCSAI